LRSYDSDIEKNRTKAQRSETKAQGTRRQILEAAGRTLKAKGMLGASTREIAREAGVADGTLYVHFSDRIELFLAMIDESLPPFVAPIIRLRELVGKRSVRANLTEVLSGTVTWHEQLLPLFTAILADPALSLALQKKLAAQNRGPHLAIDAIGAYLKAEQKLGRVHPKANVRTSALLLFGASHFWNAAKLSVPNSLGYSRETFLRDVVASVMTGLNPPARKSARLKSSRKTA
jgi:AcrR family transcriptional regulator